MRRILVLSSLIIGSPSIASVTFLGGSGSAGWTAIYDGHSVGEGTWFFGLANEIDVNRYGEVLAGTQRSQAWIDSTYRFDGDQRLVTMSTVARVEPGLRDHDESSILMSSGSGVVIEFINTEPVTLLVQGSGSAVNIGGMIVESAVTLDRGAVRVFSWVNSGSPGDPTSLTQAFNLEPGQWTLGLSAYAHSNSWFRDLGIDPLSIATLNMGVQFVPSPSSFILLCVGVFSFSRRRSA